MERTEIIKALEQCADGEQDCENCPYKHITVENDCFDAVKRDALALINELTAENEKLTINMNAYGLTAKRLAEENGILAAHHKIACEEVKDDTVWKMQS